MSDRVVAVGGSIAALVAADALARNGSDVELLLPERGVGGGFMPIERDGRRLERGIRVLELRYEGVGEPPPLAEYEAGEYGHRPYARMIEEWVRELAGSDHVVEVEPPAMVLDGALAPEMLLTSDLAPLRDHLGADDAEAIAAEAQEAAARLGDAGLLGKEYGDVLWRTTLDDASVANHGPAFHARLLAPFVEKIRPEGGRDVVAALRRKLWVPLYWPRTVREAAAGDPIGFEPYRPFHTVEPGGTGELVHRLLARVQASERVRVARHGGVASLASAPGGGVRIGFRDGGETVARRPVVGLAAGELFAATGIEYGPARVRSALAWIEVAEDDLLGLPGFVHVVDPAFDVFRLTPGQRDGAGRRILCLELRHDAEEAQAEPAGRAVLEQTGLLREGAPIELLAFFAGATFTAPTAASHAAFGQALADFEALGLDAEFAGGAVAFGADAFNEQLIQGLQAAARRAG